VANAEGEGPAIAPNTWVEIKDKVSVGREVKMEIPGKEPKRNSISSSPSDLSQPNPL
jgi:hypothetical protein